MNLMEQNLDWMSRTLYWLKFDLKLYLSKLFLKIINENLYPYLF